MKKQKIRLYQVTEFDIVAASTPSEAKKYWTKMVESDTEIISKVRCLTKQQMKERKLRDADTGKSLGSFERHLNKMIKNKEKFPQLFSTTEW